MEESMDSRIKSVHKKSNAAVVVLAALLLAVVATGAIGFSTGKIVIANNATHQAQSVSLCDAQIEQFNASYSESDREKMVALQQAVVKEISSKKYASDPTCLYMQLTVDLNSGDADSVIEKGESIMELSKKGKYMSSKLSNVASIDEVRNLLDRYGAGGNDTPEGSQSDGGQGNG